MKKLLTILALMSLASISSISYARVDVGRPGVGVGRASVGVGRVGVAGRPVARAAVASKYYSDTEGQSVGRVGVGRVGVARPAARATVIRNAR